jgi:3-phenylpropionate/cinnamic acid dioxygenase small subunit
MEGAGTASRFASALAAKDRDAMLALLGPEVEFRALTPRRTWEADDPQAVLEIVFGNWFDDSDRIEALESVESDVVADRERLRYRLSVSNPEGSFVVEQQGYLTAGEDGRIEWMRLVCSGYRPVAPS